MEWSKKKIDTNTNTKQLVKFNKVNLVDLNDNGFFEDVSDCSSWAFSKDE